MTGIGKKLRWSRFIDAKLGRSLLVPIDHGLTSGPITGISNTASIARWVAHPAINGIIAHKGIVERLVQHGAIGRGGVMVHLNGMTTLAERPDTKVMLTNIPTAIRCGADAVSIQVNFTRSTAAQNLQMVGEVVDAASCEGLPVLAMAYDRTDGQDSEAVERMRHIIRTLYELGVDAVKIEAPAQPARIPELLREISADVAIFFSGGPRCELEHLIALGALAVDHGAVGLCVGRNVFQRSDPTSVLARLHETVIRRPAD